MDKTGVQYVSGSKFQSLKKAAGNEGINQRTSEVDRDEQAGRAGQSRAVLARMLKCSSHVSLLRSQERFKRGWAVVTALEREQSSPATAVQRITITLIKSDIHDS